MREMRLDVDVAFAKTCRVDASMQFEFRSHRVAVGCASCGEDAGVGTGANDHPDSEEILVRRDREGVAGDSYLGVSRVSLFDRGHGTHNKMARLKDNINCVRREYKGVLTSIGHLSKGATLRIDSEHRPPVKIFAQALREGIRGLFRGRAEQDRG